MDPVDAFFHLIGFLAPAFFLAIAMPAVARVIGMGQSAGRGWWSSIAINFAAGAAALVAGLLVFGNDGKMATYAALVLAVATAEWVARRAWTR